MSGHTAHSNKIKMLFNDGYFFVKKYLSGFGKKIPFLKLIL
jgi:hypothetical protein